jgi:hypothetical protein
MHFLHNYFETLLAMSLIFYNKREYRGVIYSDYRPVRYLAILCNTLSLMFICCRHKCVCCKTNHTAYSYK